MCLIGFLNANTDRNARSPANYGLMDIIAALHWLQENIGAFGGDAQSVSDYPFFKRKKNVYLKNLAQEHES